MKSLNTLLFLLFVSSLPKNSFCQLIVVNNQTANQMVSRLVGDGVVYTNPTLTCPNGASGKFDNGLATTLLIDSGIVLTSGSAKTLGASIGVNAAASSFADKNNNTNGGDADLAAAASGALHDMCKLEFDFVSVGDTITFQYRFGSEEYTNYTCSNFNDIFAFFISGPGFAVPTNIAKIPGTNCPVSINTINSSTSNPCGGITSPCAPPNNALYVNNNSSPNISYDGMTVLLTAKAPVTACSTYHMKFAIADVTDHALDSGVFLKANSFVSEAAKISALSQPSAIEGCSSTIVSITRPYPKPYAQTVTLSYSGTATVGVDCNTLPISVTIPANDTIVTFSITPYLDALIEGTETIVITAYGSICNNTITDTVTTYIIDYPMFNVSNDTSICVGATATLTATSIPLNSLLTFTWNAGTTPNSGTVVSATPVTPTTYTVTAHYPGCPDRDSSILVDISPTPIVSITPTNINCSTINTGALLVTSNAVGIPTYTLNPGGQTQTSSTANFINLAAGNYTVTTTSAIGCSTTTTATITQSINLTWNSVTSTVAPCGGPGQITALVNGGAPVINYTLMPGAIVNSSGVFSNLNTGNYTITANDANNCSTDTSITITQSLVATFTTANSDPVSCFGGANGSILVGSTTPNGIVTYTITPGGQSNTTGQFNNLSFGNYTITLSDATGCTATTTINVAQPNSPVILGNPVTTTVTCFNGNNGSISQQANGGTGIITYTIQPNGTSNTSGIFTNLTANTYTIIATDANNCSVSTTVTVAQATQVQIINITNTIPSCVPGNDATLSILVNGGVPAYTYSIGTGNQSSSLFFALGTGTYTVLVTDANGCTATDTHQIVAPNQPIITNTSTTVVSCHGGSDGVLTVNASSSVGNMNYTLSPGGITNTSGSFSGLSIGNYSILATDANGCTISTTLSMTEPAALSWNAVNFTPLLCNGNSTSTITSSVSGGNGGYVYTLSPLNTNNTTGTFSGLNTFIYTITAVDSKNCSISTTVSIAQPNAIGWMSATPNNVTCYAANDGIIDVSALGGTGILTYQILPGASTNTTGNFTNLIPGLYTITVSDANGCTNTTTLQVNQPSLLQIISINTTIPSCVPGNNGTLSINSIGGTPNYTYSIGGPSQSNATFTGLNANTYTITVSDANNCSVSSTAVIQAPIAPIWTSFTTTNSNCNGAQNGQATMQINNGIGAGSYTLQPGGSTNTTGNFSNLGVGNYTATASDANSCTVSTIFSITQPTPITNTNLQLTLVTCFGNNDGIVSIQCSGGTGTINYTLLPSNLNNLTGIFTGLIAGNYTVIASDANNCTTTVTATITQPTPLTITSVIPNNAGCNPSNDGSLNITANGGTPSIIYSIGGGFSGSSNFTNLTASIYTITIKDAKGCTSTSTVEIGTTANPNIISIQTKDLLCNNDNNGQIQVAATGSSAIVNYFLSPNNRQSSAGFFDSLASGNYIIIAMDTRGCRDTSIANIINPLPLLITDVQIENTTCGNEKSGKLYSNATGGTGSITYTLQPLGFTNTIGTFSNLKTSNYTLEATDANGCTTNTNVTIGEDKCCENIFIPNAFSPNDDGKNDEFKLVHAMGIELKSFLILNRWGEIIFQTESIEDGWNGKYKGMDVDVDTYFYQIKYTCNTTKINYLLKGDVLLLR